MVDVLSASFCGLNDVGCGLCYRHAGWSEREEMNLRPAQTLGILKALFAVGAEYFHVGFFNSAARGENWVWQTVMPTYAQATAMAVNDLFRSSTLVPGDMPLATTRCYTVGYPQLKQNQTLFAQCSQAATAATTACKARNVVAVRNSLWSFDRSQVVCRAFCIQRIVACSASVLDTGRNMSMHSHICWMYRRESCASHHQPVDGTNQCHIASGPALSQ